MDYLLSENGRRELEALSKRRCLYAFDFDGTLAKIVSDPGSARLGRSVQFWLEALATRAQTAVISGRSLKDLRARVGAVVSCLVGNHGAEGPHVVQEDMFQVQEICHGWLQLITEQFQTELLECGVLVEQKSYSLSFHYRTVQQRGEARALISRIVTELDPTPRIVLGKSVVNVMPTTAWHKGTALQECIRQLGCTTALYVGDDVTDEDVFALRDPRVLTVRIGKKNASSARFFLNRQTEIAQVLRLIVEMAG
ncbi:MAG: trehalose-phosphatase [Nitrospira sp.]|nr:trehalose-phosphatase [Nitrospira sp.]